MKKVWVKLFGHHNRKILIDADATSGAQVGKTLYWPDGTVVTEDELRNIQQSAASGSSTDQNLLNYILKQLQDIQTGGVGGDITDYPLHKKELTDPLTIPADFQYLIWKSFTANEDLTIEDGGELIIFDRPLPDLKGPDFTYDVGGDLTQIDYDDGSQKLFTYGGGNLTRVDEIRDGITRRKDFVYSGDELDYITESYP